MPGLFVTPHAGDGKAHQQLLHGFKLDHGTDFATRVDGTPVSRPTNAHGQGRIGPCFALTGDFGSARATDIVDLRRPDAPFGSVTLGGNGYRRGARLASTESAPDIALLGAMEAMRNDGPWTVPGRLRRTPTVASLAAAPWLMRDVFNLLDRKVNDIPNVHESRPRPA